MSTGSTDTDLNRNDPCPCGSGKKFKKCHMGREEELGLQPRVPAKEQVSRDALMKEATNAHRMWHLDRAQDIYERVLRMNKNDPDAHTNLGMVLGAHGRHEDALEHMLLAADSMPRGTRYHLNACSQLQVMGRNEEALRMAQAVIAMDANCLGGYRLGAQALERLADLDGALALCLAGLKVNPRDPELLTLHAGTLRQQGKLEEARSILEDFVARDARPQLLAAAWNELGKVLDATELYADALAAYEKSAVTQAQTRTAKKLINADWEQLAADYRAALTPALLGRFSRADLDDGHPVPAFLLGFPASGLKQAQRLLAAQEGLVLSSKGSILDTLKQRILEMVPGEGGLPTRLQGLSLEQILELRTLYWTVASVEAGHESHVHCHALQVFDIGLIRLLFPEAKVLFTVRDPRGCAFSCFTQNFKLSSAMVHFLSIEDTVAFYGLAIGLFLDLESKLDLDLFKVRYEDSLNDPENCARKVLHFLGLEGDVQTVEQPSAVSAVGADALDHWKKYATQLEAGFAPLQRFTTAFGYDN